MSKRVVFSILSIFLLAGIVVVLRLPKMEESADNERQKLMKNAMQKYLEVEDFSLEKSRDILKKVLKEDSIKKINSDDMMENKSIFNDYVKAANEARKQKPPADASSMDYVPYVENKSIVYQEFVTILWRHNTNTKQSWRVPTTEDYLVENAMKKNGLENFQEDLAKRRIQFEVDFFKSVGDFISSLTLMEKDSQQDLIDWYNKNNGVTGPEKEGMFFEYFLGYINGTMT